MIFTEKNLSSQLKEQLKDYVYDVIGYLFRVYKQLPCGFPEYIYQEVLGIIPILLRARVKLRPRGNKPFRD